MGRKARVIAPEAEWALTGIQVTAFGLRAFGLRAFGLRAFGLRAAGGGAGRPAGQAEIGGLLPFVKVTGLGDFFA